VTNASRAAAPEATELDRAISAAGAAMEECARAVQMVSRRSSSTSAALSILLRTTGRVVVTGIGKSGLIGGKLAATFASTGTPSFFVHAADALHGDAGMVVAGDVLLALSKSGETDEVLTFASMLRDRGIPIIALTACGGSSSLCALADAVLDAGVDRESDPWGLVPTASTTASLVVGDALAIGLMVAKDFGPEQFRRHHPSGALGQRLDGPGGATVSERANQ
jgi:arabinose-5-phosphate isomerase